MAESLSVPTATSVHPVPAKLLEVNRQIINNQLGRTTGGKVSFTHLIGWAVVRALQAVPALNSTLRGRLRRQGDARASSATSTSASASPSTWRGPTASRALFVPCLKNADELEFAAFLHAYEDLVRKVRTNKLTVDDFSGVTVTITNPGRSAPPSPSPASCPGKGRSSASVRSPTRPSTPPPTRPPSPSSACRKVVVLTSTYDHRVIQGAESGLFLSRVARAPRRRARLLRRDLRLALRPLPARPLAPGRQPVQPRRRRARPARQAGGRPAADQHLPGARPPDGAPRSAPAARPPPAQGARPAHLRAHGLRPRAPLRHRGARRRDRAAARAHPRHPAGRLLQDDRHRVHAHPGSRPEALDPGARGGCARHPQRRESSATSWSG